MERPRRKSEDEFSTPRGGSLESRGFRMNALDSAGSGTINWEDVVKKLEILAAETKEDLKKLGASSNDKKKAATELGQQGFTPGSIREQDKQAGARGILAKAQHTPVEERRGEEWEKLQDRAAELFGGAIDLGRVAEVYDGRRAAEAAKPSLTPEPTTSSEPQETERIFYPRILEDLDRATQPYQRIKGVDDAGDLSVARLNNARIDSAIDDLEAVGIETGFFRGKGAVEKRNRNRLIVAVNTVKLVQSGRPIDEEELGVAVDYLRKLGVDVSQITLPTSQIGAGDQAAGQTEAQGAPDARTLYEIDLDRALLMAQGNPSQIYDAVRGWKLRNARNAEKIPQTVIARATELAREAEVAVQAQRAAQRLAQTTGTSAYGRTPEELAAAGIEERATRKDPIIVELERPIMGHKIPFEYGGTAFMGGLRAERRAVEDDESFLGERVKLLLAPIWSESLRIYNGEVTGETKADFTTLSTIESLLRTRIGEIQKTLADARKGEKPGEAHKLYFASLIPSEVDLGVGDITQKMLEGGFGVLTEEQVARIPEIKALKEMKQILSWHEAQLQLLRTLQAMRSYSAGKKIESISALGEQAERPLLPTGAVIRIWGLEQLESTSESQTPEEAEARMVAKYTEDAMRIYSLIADVSREWPTFTAEGRVSFKAENKVDAGLKRLIWKHLLVRDLVTEGTVPLDVRFVLNRFGQGLNSERLATVEAFVEHLVTSGAMNTLAKLEKAGVVASLDGLIAKLDAGLTGTISSAIERAKEEMLGETKIKMVPEAELTPREKEIQLGCANAVATIHVTGLADQLSKFYAWTVPAEKIEEKVEKAKGRGKTIWIDGEQPRIPMIKVGGYPACTAASELMNWTAKLEASRDIGLPIGPATLEDALRKGILPPSLAKTFFEYTTLNVGGKVASLWNYWDGQKMPIYKLTQMMAEKLGPNMHGAWLTSLKSSNQLRSLLTSTDKETFSGMYVDDKLLGDISSALYFGLGPTHTGSKEPVDAVLKAVIYAGLLTYNNGITSQVSSMEVHQRLSSLGIKRGINDEISYFLQKIITDGVAGKAGAVDQNALGILKNMIEPYFVSRLGRSVTQTTAGSAAFLVNEWIGPKGRQAVRFADIWNGKIPLK